MRIKKEDARSSEIETELWMAFESAVSSPLEAAESLSVRSVLASDRSRSDYKGAWGNHEERYEMENELKNWHSQWAAHH